VGILLIQAAGFGFLIVAFVVLLFVIFLLGSAVRIVNEYERGVIFRLGRVQGHGQRTRTLLLNPDSGQDGKDRP
jgi:regulator of protease activity HflC (stomatin/prohibitin superfamily)